MCDEIRLSSISIPKIFAFLTEVEKSDYYIRIQDLKINAQGNDNLFFDALVIVRAYTSSSG